MLCNLLKLIFRFRNGGYANARRDYEKVRARHRPRQSQGGIHVGQGGFKNANIHQIVDKRAVRKEVWEACKSRKDQVLTKNATLF